MYTNNFMFLILDILLIIVIVIIVLMVYSGFISLTDRKVMALTQNRIGPGLFLFGMCTPIFDGVKLILKFGLLVLNVELFYLFLIIVYSLIFNYMLYFMMPLSTIILINMNFNHFILLSIHSMLAVVNTFLVGCFILNTCFIYLATLRTILFSIISEFCMIIVFLYMTNVNFIALFNFVILNIFNTLLLNILILPIFVTLLIIICIYLQNLINIFEFAEAESELVAGTITEFSGIFFCISSLIEISHIILSTYLVITMLCGGFFINYKILLCLLLVFLVPKLLLCRLKINNALLFLIFYVLNYLFLYLLVLNIIKILYVINF